MDQILLKDLRVRARIGVGDAERAQAQTLVVNVTVDVDARAAGASDELSDTVDYGDVAGRVAAVARSGETRLLEHLAERIAGEVAATAGVSGVTVEVQKDRPPVGEDVRAVAVRIERPG